MTVEEIKAKLPEAEVYELQDDCRYLVVVSRNSVSRASVEGLLQGLPQRTAVLRVDDPETAIRILEVKEGENGPAKP